MTPRARIVELDKRYLWHPYTAMGSYLAEVDPLVIARAAGVRLYDIDGRSYLDGNASWWTAVLGHAHPRLLQALSAQAAALAHTSLAGVTHEPAARLAEELASVAPAGRPLGAFGWSVFGAAVFAGLVCCCCGTS